MSSRKWSISLLVLLILASTYLALQYSKSSEWFVAYPLPLEETHRFFDIGIVDANGDEFLDIYTSNHHFRQSLLIADGQGGYRDMLSKWKLDQSLEFPLAELSFSTPIIDSPGLYIYWLGTRVVLRTHKTNETRNWQGMLHIHEPVEIIMNDGFTIRKEERELSIIEKEKVFKTNLEFSSSSDGKLVLNPGGQGLPLNFQLSNFNPMTQVYVGLGKVSPASTHFSLTMQDRHALAWADYNNDGLLDIFIPRGALGGSLRAYPDEVVRNVKDELLVSQADGRFTDIASKVGIHKKGCSGRHAKWVDFNQDGLLDLFINCYDRKNVIGKYPKQLYQQDMNGEFQDVAVEAGIGLPDQQIGSFIWFDVDNDGDPDLVTLQNQGFFLYRNNDGQVTQESIYKRPLSGVQIGSTTEGTWVYDGKLSTADYDRDGDIDIFASSKRGNVLLVNEGGRFNHIDPVSVGLPETSLNATWVDYDNDGLPDLHTVSQGLFRQGQEYQFDATDILHFPDAQYQAAVSNWFDLDNDGRLDIMMALNPNPDFDQWWRSVRKPRSRTTWLVDTYRNIGASNHWLQIKLIGRDGNREAIGARVSVFTLDGQQTQEIGSSEGSFFSQGHYRLYFGLGKHDQLSLVRIRWPDGSLQELENVSGDKLLVIERDTIGLQAG